MNLVIANKEISVLINDKSIDIDGTHLHGYIHCSYFQLIKKLGLPNVDMGGDKVRAEWTVQVTIDNKKVVATIYDWKEFQPIQSVTHWHIGGHNEESVKLVKAIFPDLPVENYR